MKKAILLTAYNRPHYFQEVLDSWAKVDDLDDWDILVTIEPNAFAEDQLWMAKQAFRDFAGKLTIEINPQVYGVLHNPWVGFERLFGEGYDFVVRAEDDLVVSKDILQFFSWAAENCQNDDRIVSVNAFTHTDGAAADEVTLVDEFNPWVWGTWRDRWEGLLGPTWDHDYSTYNGTPGNQAGWDWNINTRLFPQYNLLSAQVTRSRVHNIGKTGTHAVEADYITSVSFSPDHGEIARYRRVDG